MTTAAPRVGSLCSGYGGLDMAVEAVIPDAELAWVSDIDKGACKVLAHRYPDVPNLGDFTKTDWATVEPVDILAAGFPCQPVSGAGKQLGFEDERWLWDDVLRAVCELRPGLVVLENVRGLLAAGSGRLFGRVLGSLAGVGFDAEWLLVPASGVGAPHGRPRVFIVATDAQRGRRDGWSLVEVGSALGRAASVGRAEGALLPAPGAYDAERGGPQLPAKRRAGGHSVSLQDALHSLTLLPTPWGPYAAAVERWEQVIGRPAPLPSERARVREWMMGLPDGWITAVPDVTDNEAVKLAGNGVVPQQAAAALRIMLARAEVAA